MAEAVCSEVVAPEAASASASLPVSFGFSRTTVRKLLPGAEEREKEEKDYLHAVEGRELQSVNPVEAPKELMIPLIQKNRWQTPKPALCYNKEKGEQEQGPEDGVLSQAVKELIQESKRSLEVWEGGPKDDPNLLIPLLMQNRVPNGYEDGDKVDVSLRPESATEVDYEAVPVEAYGMAMLRGMGWKEGEGIGRTFKQDVKPLEHQLRPKGLGLGADRSAVKDLEPARPKRPRKPGEEKLEDEPQGLVTGAFVQIEGGPHKELYGTVEGVDPDNARVMVKLAIGGKVVTITQYSLKLVNKKEFEKYGRDLSRLSKAHKEKKEEGRSKPSSRETERKEQKRKRQDEADRDSHTRKELKEHADVGVSSNGSSSQGSHWLQRDLRVRFIDKLYKGGKYYNVKMTIEAVLMPYTCVCRTEDGQILYDIKESMLETVIPKEEDSWIMVVLGPQRGQIGRILHRNKEKTRVLVQLQSDEVNVLKLDFDAVCHYIGESDG
ncbi:G-patch domain and KOW motifs-containing protein [Rhinatrema bivittatum]|uniref:G-patch domain and KOW motifs-containing protein n=1 Tax=Rhinatrema bivittatum TaxID=194408 RepID=UPI001125C8A9|nr:G-patch domain and KOW motifs-containing protein [Rhinatrema bivittatum]